MFGEKEATKLKNNIPVTSLSKEELVMLQKIFKHKLRKILRNAC